MCRRRGRVRKLSEDRFVLGFVVLCAAWILFGLPFLYGPPPRFAQSGRPPQAGSEQAAQNPQANAQPDSRGMAQEAQVRGETSQDAWETRRRAQESRNSDGRAAQKTIDERARTNYFESAFSDAMAVYMLSLAVDFDYHDLREREYPLLAAPALAERLRHVAGLFPTNPGYEFQILYRRKG